VAQLAFDDDHGPDSQRYAGVNSHARFARID
jgi:hypothetical protein